MSPSPPPRASWDNGTITSNSGALQLTDTGGSINVGNLVAQGGSIFATGNAGPSGDQGITIGSVSASGGFTLTNQTGLVSLGGINAGSISVGNNGGDITLNGGDTTTGSGNIDVTASGNIIYTNNVSAGGYLTLNAGGQVSDNNAGNALSAGIQANITGASLNLYTVTGGTAINLIATGGNAGFAGLTATTGDVDVTDTGGSINGGNLTASSGSIGLTGDQGINVGASSASSGFTVTNSNGTETFGSIGAGEGGIDITNTAGSVILNGGDTTTNSGVIYVNTPAGGITYTNNISAAGALSFKASGPISDNNAGNALSGGSVSVTGGNLNLYNVTGTTGVALTAAADVLRTMARSPPAAEQSSSPTPAVASTSAVWSRKAARFTPAIPPQQRPGHHDRLGQRQRPGLVTLGNINAGSIDIGNTGNATYSSTAAIPPPAAATSASPPAATSPTPTPSVPAAI